MKAFRLTDAVKCCLSFYPLWISWKCTKVVGTTHLWESIEDHSSAATIRVHSVVCVFFSASAVDDGRSGTDQCPVPVRLQPRHGLLVPWRLSTADAVSVCPGHARLCHLRTVRIPTRVSARPCQVLLSMKKMHVFDTARFEAESCSIIWSRAFDRQADVCVIDVTGWACSCREPGKASRPKLREALRCRASRWRPLRLSHNREAWSLPIPFNNSRYEHRSSIGQTSGRTRTLNGRALF